MNLALDGSRASGRHRGREKNPDDPPLGEGEDGDHTPDQTTRRAKERKLLPDQ